MTKIYVNWFKIDETEVFYDQDQLINVKDKGNPLICFANLTDGTEKISVMTNNFIYTYENGKG